MQGVRKAVAILLVSLCGCGGASGPERCAVTGLVSIDGEPIESGTITFIPASGKGPSAGAAINAGRYEIAAEVGPAIGTHRVEIIGFKSEGTQTVEGVQGSTVGPSGTASVAALKMIVPEEFNTKSTLQADIKSGKNEANYPLKRP